MITLHHLVSWVCLTFFTVFKACPFSPFIQTTPHKATKKQAERVEVGMIFVAMSEHVLVVALKSFITKDDLYNHVPNHPCMVYLSIHLADVYVNVGKCTIHGFDGCLVG